MSGEFQLKAGTPIADPDAREPSRGRGVLSVAILAVVGVFYWFMLTGVQSLILPHATGGAGGPWVFRPIRTFHFGATAVLSCVTAPYISRVLRKKLKALDLPKDPFGKGSVRHTRYVVQACLLLPIWCASLVFYLSSWTVIGPTEVVEHLPWAKLRHPYQDIASLRMIPEGERSESLAKDGPHYFITLRSGRTVDLSLDCEGATAAELKSMAGFVTERTGLGWTRWGDAK